MLSASHIAESLRDSEVPQLGCGVSLGEADLRGGVQRDVSNNPGLNLRGLASRTRVGFEVHLAQVGGR